MQQFLFYFFASISLIFASSVVAFVNPMRSVLALMVTFVSTAALWLLLRAEFLSIVLVLVYVGAVMVLFLFVIMMLDIDKANKEYKISRKIFIFLLIPVFFDFLLIYGFSNYYDLLSVDKISKLFYSTNFDISINNVKSLGYILYSKYLFPFEIAGILLLVGIVSSVILSFRGIRNRKNQSMQSDVVIIDRIKLVDGN
ncbi:MAG: NADH-quinone oxidoreductase subunit J [Candidatus Azosocius agrarius]|nr:MAG: NADH-quinone oxidoreductase subunit J [Gammaproteobacteria bacterium]